MNDESERPGADPLITYTIFADRTAASKTERADVPFSDLCERIRNAPSYPRKDACPWISLCEYGDVRTAKNSLRHAANVRRIFGVEIDYDGEQVSIDEATARLGAAGLEAVLYTSPSHTRERPRWRVLLPLSDPAPPEKRAEFVGRANRALGGVASRESFTLSQSYYIGRVADREYETRETHGRTIDLAADLEAQYFIGGDGATRDERGRDMRSDADLRAAFATGHGRYETMQKLSSRWAAKGMAADDIEAVLLWELGDASLNADGVDLRSRATALAESAVRKFGETRAAPEPRAQAHRDAGQMAITARSISEILANPSTVRWLLRDTLERGVIAVIAGKRGSFKSFIALHWAMRTGQSGLPVVMVSAEGAGLDRRLRAWATHFATDITGFPIYAIERRVDFTSLEATGGVVEELKRIGVKPALLIIDTFSKNTGRLDENDNSEVKEFIGQLDSRFRAPFDCTVLLVAHTGHADQSRVRGASALEADTDAAYIVTRNDLRVTVSRQRFKDSPELAALGYEAKAVDLGYADEYGVPVQSFVMIDADVKVVEAANQVGRGWGKNQAAAVTALKEWTRTHPNAPIIDQKEVSELLKAQDISRQRKPEVLASFVNAGLLTTVTNGYIINRKELP
jgi:KaiC/GvpD/RAD55 family RecA-like ATPase